MAPKADPVRAWLQGVRYFYASVGRMAAIDPKPSFLELKNPAEQTLRIVCQAGFAFSNQVNR